MREAFERPLASFDAYCNQLGRYQELSLAIEELGQLIRGKEGEEDEISNQVAKRNAGRQRVRV